MLTEPITADKVLINGNKYSSADAAWQGLDFSEAMPLAHIDKIGAWTITVLRVPWVHPEDRARKVVDWSIYRIRPRDPLARFKNIDGQWHMVTE